MYSIQMGQSELFEEIAPDGNLPGTDTAPGECLAGLYELSSNAYHAALYAIMSERPIRREISRFTEKVLKAGQSGAGCNTEEARIAADKAATDRGDPDVLTILKAAGQVQHEIHRLTGLLRFSREENGAYVARCSPDFRVLPALADHFTLRFGETPWAIIDEKRKLCLCRLEKGPARLIPWEENPANAPDDESWEDLWRLYFRSINNEARANPRLQRQLMPERYRKYLPELEQGTGSL